MDMSWQALLQEAAATSFEKTADTLAAAENDNCACIDLHQQQIHELSKKILLLPHQGRVLLLSRYGLLTEDTNKSTNRIFCNEVYGSLVLSPELSQAHISDIVYVMKILSENVMDENGYVRMLELRNTLQS